MNFYFLYNNILYPAIEFTGRTENPEWDKRETKTIHLEMTYKDAISIFQNGLSWSIVTEWYEYPKDENGEEILEEEPIFHRDIFDNSDFNLAGPITDNRDGTLYITMGKMTDLENAYELLYGGIE